MNDNNFLLNPETYETSYKPVFNYDREKEFQLVIQYLIVLPFELALTDDGIISFREAKEHYSFSFSRQERQKGYSAGGKGSPKNISYYETCVEMSLFTEKVYYLTEKTLTEVFERLLNQLNFIIVSYLVKTKQKDIFKVSKETLEPFCLFRKLNLPEFTIKEEGLFSLHTNVVHKKELLNHYKQTEIAEFAGIIRDGTNPFILTEELMMDAIRNLRSGFYTNAIIKAQTSVESLLRTLYTEMLKIEGIAENQIKTRQELGFITIVKKEFANRIGGSWDITNSRKELGYWYKNCYELRNRIIHAGYHPDINETNRGIDSVQKLREFIVKRLSRTPKFQELTTYL